MSATPEDTARKVRRLDNDVQSIYEMLATLVATQQSHGNRLDEIGGRVDEIGRRVDEIGTAQGQQDGKLDRILELLER